MSGLILCRNRTAEHPYTISGTDIYSLEELCYYLKNNIYAIDEGLLSGELCSWIEEEFGKTVLAASIRSLIGEKGGLKDLVRLLARETGYYGKEEAASLAALIENLEGLDKEERLKLKGDALIAERRYRRALEAYCQALTRTHEPRDDERNAAIWNNIGTAYAGLFLFSQAAQAFKKSFDMEPKEEAYLNFLCAMRFVTPHEEYAKAIEDEDISLETVRKFESRLAEAGEEEKKSSLRARIAAADKNRREGRITRCCREFDEIVQEWKKEYRERESG